MAIEIFRGKYHFLSNFYPSKFTHMGMEYPSVEHAYQSSKTEDEKEFWDIIHAPYARIAKKKGSEILYKRKDFNIIKLGIMSIYVHCKFSQNEDLKTKLLETGDEEIIETNYWGDTYWGVCNGVGKNHLGKILMKVRRNLKQ